MDCMREPGRVLYTRLCVSVSVTITPNLFKHFRRLTRRADRVGHDPPAPRVLASGSPDNHQPAKQITDNSGMVITPRFLINPIHAESRHIRATFAHLPIIHINPCIGTFTQETGLERI